MLKYLFSYYNFTIFVIKILRVYKGLCWMQELRDSEKKQNINQKVYIKEKL